jgi:hypothetical protein
MCPFWSYEWIVGKKEAVAGSVVTKSASIREPDGSE